MRLAARLPRVSPRRARFIVWVTTCGVIAFLFAFPFLTLLIATLKPPAELNLTPPTYWPSRLSLESFVELLDLGNGIWVHLGNSLYLAVFTVVGTVVVATLAGWGFARFRFPGQTVMFVAMLAALMVPGQALLTPLFLTLKALGLGNTLLGVALVYVAYQLPFAIFLIRNAFLDVPQAIDDAAQVDGASGLKLFGHILFPMIRPGTITIALFAFFASWNEYVTALILLQKQSLFPLPVALNGAIVSGLTGVNWSLLQSGVVVSMAPCLLLFFVLQRYYVSGLVAGAVKD